MASSRRSGRFTSDKARKLGFASGLEVKVSEQLKSLGRDFDYETDECKFDYVTKVRGGVVIGSKGKELPLSKGSYIGQKHVYTCDFKIIKSNGESLFIETKGYFKAPDRTKHLILKKLYPDADLRIIFQSNGRVSKKTSYKEWAEKHDIKYHVLTAKEKREGRIVPEEWLNA